MAALILTSFWLDGFVRHLDVSDTHPRDSVSTTSDGDLQYTLHVHPAHAHLANEYREKCERALERYFEQSSLRT